MKFYNVSYIDLGMYQCILKYDNKDISKKLLSYNYNLQSHNVYIFKEGSNVNLTCKNDNKNNGKIILKKSNLKNNNIFCLNDTFCQVNIKNGSKYNNSIFECKKYIGDKIKIIYAIVLFTSYKDNDNIKNKHLNGLPYIFKSFPNTFEVKEGDTIFIPCIFKSFIFSSTILNKWIFKTNYNGNHFYNNSDFIKNIIVDESNFSILKLSNISQYDTGTYICKIASEYGVVNREFYVYIKPSRPLIHYFKNTISFLTISTLPLSNVFVRFTPHDSNLDMIEYIFGSKNIIDLGNFKYVGYMNTNNLFNYGSKYNLTLAVSHKFSKSTFSTSFKLNDYFILNEGFIDYYNEKVDLKNKEQYNIIKIYILLPIVVLIIVYFNYSFFNIILRY
uniref:Ig-like domain-containing protein n=1 Tax=Strongyloides stercoralis TaxID=6248 RepID=A0A0K0E4T6_STRER